jgi:hypothetical protein
MYPVPSQMGQRTGTCLVVVAVIFGAKGLLM